MLTARTSDLELLTVWQDSDPDVARVHPAFPINHYTGAADSAIVYFEVEPGDRLPRHTDSEEEILYIVAGEAEAEVGDERGDVRAGDLAVIPAMVPHGVRNTGDETLKVVGFFSGSKVHSTFEEPLQPLGMTGIEMGAPVPA
jgi:quercetin dioxygenase-like cupin family protein